MNGRATVATMQEVATRAGVSIATVSFVVNGTKRVSPATRERVTAAMAELGFRNNVVARALASKRTRVIALLYPAVATRLGATSLEFFISAASRASELGYHLVLWPVTTTADDVDELTAGGLIDGVILMEVTMEDRRIERLTALRVPFVSIGRTASPESMAYVDMDFERTVEDSLDYLTGLGHRRIGLVVEDLEGSPMAGYGPHVRTESSYRASMTRRGLTPLVARSGASSAGGREAAAELLVADPALTGVLIMKDDSTVGLLSGLNAAGLSVPSDVSVLLVASSTDVGARTDPSLSTMVAPGRELGRLAAEALINQLDGDVDASDMPHVLLPCVLHVAGSTGPAPALLG